MPSPRIACAFTHIIAYAIRGFIECGVLLGDERYLNAAETAAVAVAGAQRPALLGTASDVRTAMEAAVANRLGVPLVVNGTDAPGLPGSRQEWVFSVEVTGDLEARAYATARALLDGIETARTIDPVALRNALVNR